MRKLVTYTPNNFRKHSYDLFNCAKNNQDIRVTIRSKNNGKNADILVINEAKIHRLLTENRILKERELSRKIDLATSQLSSNPIFKNPTKFEEWCEKNDD